MSEYTDGLIGASSINCNGTAVTITATPIPGSVLYCSSSSTLTPTPAGTANQLIQSNGSSAPSWISAPVISSLSLTSPLTIANGGTNTTTIGSAGSVIYSNGSGYVSTAVGTSGQFLRSNGSSAPSWTTVSASSGNVLYFNSNGNITANNYIAQSFQSSGLGNGTFIMSRDGTVTGLYMSMFSTAGVATPPGAGNTRTVTIWKGAGGVAPTATAFTVSVSGASQSANSASSSLGFTAGDTFALRMTVTGTPAAAVCLVSLFFN